MLHSSASPQALGVYRIVVGLIWAVHFWLFDPAVTAALPGTLFQCSGVLCLLPTAFWEVLHTHEGLILLKWFGLAAALAFAAGLRPFPAAAVPLCVLALLYDGTMKGYGGFINHAQFGALYSALLLAFFPAADGLSVLGAARRKADPRLYAAPLLVAGIALGMAYAFVAGNRFLTGGVDVFVGDSLRHWVILRTFESARYAFETGLIIAENEMLYRLMLGGFLVTTLFELLSPLALFFRRLRWIWLAVLVPFHVMTMFTMNILFWENLLLILVIFTPLAHAATPARAREKDGPILFIDGECVLCHGFARRLMRWDREGVIRLGVLQGETAKELGAAPPAGKEGSWSVVLWRDGEIRMRSDASLGALVALGGAWRLLRVVLLVPRPLRDGVYAFVARNRYRWFGKRETCGLPSAEDRKRLVP